MFRFYTPSEQTPIIAIIKNNKKLWKKEKISMFNEQNGGISKRSQPKVFCK